MDIIPDIDVHMLLDNSSSMSDITNPVEKMVNEYTQGLITLGLDGTFSLSTFDNSVKKRIIDDVDLDLINPISYSPNGCTAFYDALGEILTEEKVPKVNTKKLFIIITDGQENQSRIWKTRVPELIQLVDTCKQSGIGFMYLSSDKRSFEEGKKLHLHGLASMFQKTAVGLENMTSGMLLATRNFCLPDADPEYVPNLPEEFSLDELY